MKKPKRQCQIGKLLKHIIKQVRSFTSFQMVHTHTALSHTHATLSQTIFRTTTSSHTTTLSHTTLSHTTWHTLSHTQSFSHNFVTHSSFTHTQLCQRQSFTHNFVTHTQPFTHIFVTHIVTHNLSHTHSFVTHTIFYTQICQSCVRMQLLKLSILHHLHCPFCFLRAASTTFSDYWKKLTCGVLRSFNCLCMLMLDLVFGYTCFIIL